MINHFNNKKEDYAATESYSKLKAIQTDQLQTLRI